MTKRIFTAASILLAIILISGCDKGSPTSPIGPTPAGDNMAKTDLVLQFTAKPNNRFDLVVTAQGPGLSHAIMLARALGIPEEESWSGSLLWLHDATRTNFGAIVTSIPFTPPSSDRFSFSNVQHNGSIDLYFEFQPGGTTRRIQTVLDPDRIVTPGQTGFVVKRPGPDNPQYRIQGPAPR